ncbi:hypothetical protein D3C83_153630 [compost metagenome]
MGPIAVNIVQKHNTFTEVLEKAPAFLIDVVASGMVNSEILLIEVENPILEVLLKKCL